MTDTFFDPDYSLVSGPISRSGLTTSSNDSVKIFEARRGTNLDYDLVRNYMSENSDGVSDFFSFGSNSSDDGPAEFLRDQDIRIGRGLGDARTLEDAPQEVKDAAARLRINFDQSSLGEGETLRAIKDYGTDVLSSPETLLTVGGGLLGLSARAGVKEGVKQTLRKQTLDTIIEGGPRMTQRVAFPASMATYAGVGDVAYQDLEESIGLREEYDPLQTLVFTGLGAAGGSVISETATGVVKHRLKREAIAKALETTVTPKVIDDKVGQLFDSPAFAKAIDEVDIEFVEPSGPVTSKTINWLEGVAERADANSEFFDEAVESIKTTLTMGAEKGILVNAEDISQLKQLRNYITEMGYGEETIARVSESLATSQGEVTGDVASTISQAMGSATSNFFFGKQTGFLTAFRKASPMARSLQIAITPDEGKVWTGKQDAIPFSLFETYKNYSGSWMTKYMGIVEPVSDKGAKAKINGLMTPEMNDKINVAMRGGPTGDKTANMVGMNLRRLYSEIGDKLLDYGLIDEKIDNYTHRMWHRDHILNNREKFESLLVSEGQAADAGAARAITDSMLSKNEQLDTSDASPHFFNKKRILTNIKDDSKFAEFFEQDVRLTMAHYIHQSSKAVAKMERLGVRDAGDFEKLIANKIIEEVGDQISIKGKRVLKTNLMNLYRTVTSEGLDRYGPTGTSLVDGYSTATRISLLGMSTITSLTEPLINIHKAGVRRSIKGFQAVTERGFKSLTGDFETKLQNDFGLTAKEAKRELYENGLALEHGLMSVSNRLVGDELTSETSNKINNAFFKVILLDQWTKMVQGTSFVTGKKLIYDNLKTLAAHNGEAVNSRTQRKLNELAELNVDVEEGMRWFRDGAKTDDPFYKNVKMSAARYANEVILQPSSMSGQKPYLFNHPKTSFLYQLLTYPTAFTNTILKGMAKKVVRDRDPKTVARVASGALVMTEVQRMLNYYRSNGKSEDEGTAKAYLKAVERVGLFTVPLDQMRRAAEGTKYQGNISPYFVVAPFGVFGSDLMSFVSQGPVTTIGQRLPGYTVPYEKLPFVDLPDDYRKQYRNYLREVDGRLYEVLKAD